MQSEQSTIVTPQREVFDYQDSYLIENLERELEKFSHLLEKSPDRGLSCNEYDNADHAAEEIQRFEVENLREQNSKLQFENEKSFAKIQNIMSKIPKTLENHLIVHRLEKENMQLRALVDQSQKENLQLQNELMRLQELHENQEPTPVEDSTDAPIIARFEAMMLNYASNSFSTKQEDKIKELQSKLLKKNEEFAMLRKSFETEIADYQEKIRGLTEEVQRLRVESERMSRDHNNGLMTKKSLRKIRELNQNLLNQIAMEEDGKKSRAKKPKRSTHKLAESDEENIFDDSNAMCEEDEEFAPEEMSEDDEERRAYPKKRKANVKKKPNNNEAKKMKKNEFKEALSQARNTIAYHLFN